MSPLRKFFPECVKAEYHATAVVWLVEEAGMLVGGQFSQGILNEFLGCTGIEIPPFAVHILNTGGRNRAAISPSSVMEGGDVNLGKFAVFVGFVGRFAVDGIARDAVPEIDGI